MKLIIGLGNPGRKYKKTKHNFGFLVLDKLAGKNKWHTNQNARVEYLRLDLNNHDVALLKPQTYMNNSGQAVSATANYYNIDIDHIIIISDDKDMEFGKIRFRSEGGSGGHNGIASVIEHLSTEFFKRIKIGVKNEHTDMMDTADFVLSRFSKEEEQQLSHIIEIVISHLQKIIHG